MRSCQAAAMPDCLVQGVLALVIVNEVCVDERVAAVNSQHRSEVIAGQGLTYSAANGHHAW
jgi:hypothetical protein